MCLWKGLWELRLGDSDGTLRMGVVCVCGGGWAWRLHVSGCTGSGSQEAFGVQAEAGLPRGVWLSPAGELWAFCQGQTDAGLWLLGAFPFPWGQQASSSEMPPVLSLSPRQAPAASMCGLVSTHSHAHGHASHFHSECIRFVQK